MNKAEHIKYWIETAEEDLASAQALFESKKYSWCLFISHLVIEKLLKAHFVNDYETEQLPKTHDLLRIADKIKLDFSEKQKNFLEEINDFNIAARYPDYKREFYKLCTFEYTNDKFNVIKELIKWLKSNLKY